jgi:CDGSH-type Zn-finger protein
MSDHGNAADQDRTPSPRSRGRREDSAVVTVYEDGPLIVRGRFAITAQDGQPIPAGRRTVALCRCGRSAIKPFCDGSHARTGFRAPGGALGTRAAAQDPGGGRGTWQPLAGVADSAAEPAGQGEPAAD